jgi:hypothetical protein
MNSKDERKNRRGVGSRRRDVLILALLCLFTVQCVRSTFFNNESSLDWSTYAAGTAALPYQGRVGMVPVLRWAQRTGWMVRGAARYQVMMVAGARYREPVTVEKFASLLVGLAAAFVLLGYAVWYGRRRGVGLWWLPSVLLLGILTVSLVVRSEHTVWTPYDLPHTALFGIAVMCAFEGGWLAMLLLFVVDVPVRETSIFLIAVAAPFAFLHWKRLRGGVARVAALIVGMAAYWEMWQVMIRRRFEHNPSDTGPRVATNLHEILFPHHWPQTLCVGGYLIIFIWLERHLLSSRERLLLYSTLICAPITLYYGVWGETRIWLEWSLPWAILGTREFEGYLRQRNAVPDRMEERSLVA